MSVTPVRARPLAPNERVYALGSITVWNTVCLEGPVDLAVLRDAWGLLRREHPVLTGRFVANQDEFLPGIPGIDLVVPAEAEVTELHVREGVDGEAAQLKIIPDEERFTRSCSPDELAFVDVAPQDDGQTLVSFVVSHALGDGRLNTYWTHRLWEHYTDLVAGRTPAVEPHPVPKTVQALLAERDFTIPPDPGASRLAKAKPTELDVSNWQTSRQRIRLSREDTAVLRDRARGLGQSMNSLLLGAVAVVERRWLPVPHDEPIDINLRVLVDLRDRLDPPVPAWGGTNVLGGVDAVVSVPPDGDPVAIGAEAHGQIQEDLQSDVALRDFLRDRSGDFTKDKRSVPRSLVTNAGVAKPVPVPAALRVADYRRWAEQDWTPLFELTGGKGPKTYDCSLHGIFTYDGRLSVEMGVPQSSDDARARAEELEGLLVGLARRT